MKPRKYAPPIKLQLREADVALLDEISKRLGLSRAEYTRSVLVDQLVIERARMAKDPEGWSPRMPKVLRDLFGE